MPRGIKKYAQATRKPFYQVVAERMEETTDRTKKALSTIYGSNDPLLIDAYEQVIDTANILAMAGDQKGLIKLLGKTTSVKEDDKGNGRRGGRKPELTTEIYLQAKKDNKTDEWLAQNYSFNGQKLGSMRRHHGLLKGE